ncbi:hypothetical protein RYA05_05105 [Pseudomonas syringae pv. actinidiae]|nr:hypothetical protein [Pseudomonas syringae pv. actinidiae]
MIKLSRFTNSLNEAFGSNIAIPRGQDYQFLRKVLGESFEQDMETFKSACIHQPKKNVLTELTGVSYPTAHTVGGRTLFYIDFSADKSILKDDIVEYYKNDGVPSVKFTRTEFETFTLFHEIGHSSDEKVTYHQIDSAYGAVDDLTWQGESFADYFATIMMHRAAGPGIVDDRLMPLRALSSNYIYQTTGAIRAAKSVADSHNLNSLSEREILNLAISSWNKIPQKEISAWSREACKNLSALQIVRGVKKCEGVVNLLNVFPRNIHQSILDTLATFLEKNSEGILKNSMAFRAPLRNIRMIENCLMRDIQRGDLPKNREKVYDESIDRYLRRFPDCQIIKNKICHQINAAI